MTYGSVLELTRRQLLQRGGYGLGAVALASLLNRPAAAGPDGVARRETIDATLSRIAPPARNVIYLHMVGAPSHLDLLENKPKLREHDGEPCPDRLLTKGQQFAFIRGHPKLLGAFFDYQKSGQSGREISDLLPHLASVADRIAVVKSMHTEEFNHGPAQLFMMTGTGRIGRPSLGSWVSYGLGSENSNLPAFVVLNSGGAIAGAGSALWSSGFLPSAHQGVEFRSEGDPVLFLNNPKGIDPTGRRRIIDSVNHLNRLALADIGDPEIATRIAQYEMAFRMQISVPELMDTSTEPEAIHVLYGTQRKKGATFAKHCLLARRLVERGVRFVQLYNDGWDHHSNLRKALPGKAAEIDQPAAALLKDLEQRGLLDETLVIWGGEFGRTPVLQGKSNDGKSGNIGRDHHKDAFAIWMAGGGVKPGINYGASDELGFHVTENPMHVNDLHATILHLLGIKHTALTYRYQGRDFRLTDVSGKVAHGLLA